jgi:aspartyl-tRNA(Asn)/glutamyl-tRNA(Gln) amidotransferase subunit A
MITAPLFSLNWRDIHHALQQPNGSQAMAEQVLAAIQETRDSNAYRRVDPDRVRAEAAAADARRKVDSSASPLLGLPVSVKDLFVVEGYDTMAGTPKPLDKHLGGEGPVVRSLRNVNVVVTGKTHTVEFAFGGIGTNPHYPTPINPWDLAQARVPGGSSSGAGVSLWSGTAALALGSDTAGSVRVPASLNGCIGLKTTHGRWALDGIAPLSPSLDTAGILALDAEIIAEAFKVIDPEVNSDTAISHRAWPGVIDGVRIGVLRSGFDDTEAGIAEATERALKELEAAGAVLQDIELPEAADALELFKVGGVAGIEFAGLIANQFPDWRETLDPNVQQRFKSIEQATAIEYLRRLNALTAMQQGAARRMDAAEIDVIESPAVPISPPTQQEVAEGDRYVNRNMLALRNTVVGNFLKLSGFTIPCGKDALNLPVGLMLMARGGADVFAVGLLLAVQRVLGKPYDRLGVPPRFKK